MFTLKGTVKRSVAESVRDKASVYTRGATFQAVSAPLKVRRDTIERSVSVGILKEFPFI